jgi:hypothetical protein
LAVLDVQRNRLGVRFIKEWWKGKNERREGSRQKEDGRLSSTFERSHVQRLARVVQVELHFFSLCAFVVKEFHLTDDNGIMVVLSDLGQFSAIASIALYSSGVML